MLNNYELMKKLTNDINRLQNIIEHKKLYNIRNTIVRILLKSGIAIDYAFPFILAAVITVNIQALRKNLPFRIDEIPEKARVETIDTSSGTHIEHISYDFSYDDTIIEYSTGWIINEKGLYERTATSYKLNDDVDLENTEKIMAMSKEELESMLTVTNVETIKKKVLSSNDMIYNSDSIIVIKHVKSEEEKFKRLETRSENFWNSLIFVVSTLYVGWNLKIAGILFIITTPKDKLKEYEPSFRQITIEELETMKDIIKLKQENLAMLNSEVTNTNGNEQYSRKLRKD